MKVTTGKIILAALLVAAAILVYLSSIIPWWVMTVTEVTTGRSSWLHIYAWGLIHNMSELRQFVARHETPPYLMLAAKLYLASLVALALASAALLFAKPRLAWAPALAAGATYLLYTLAFLPVLHEGTSTAPRPIPMQGEEWEFVEMYSVHIITYFEQGYYLSLASSLLLLALGLIAWKLYRKSDAS